jgi:hypothetical protein
MFSRDAFGAGEDLGCELRPESKYIEATAIVRNLYETVSNLTGRPYEYHPCIQPIDHVSCESRPSAITASSLSASSPNELDIDTSRYRLVSSSVDWPICASVRKRL